MANRLTMAQIDAILTLHKTRKSNRKIADLLEIDRGTVGKYLRQADAQNRPNAPTGSSGRPRHSKQTLASRHRAVECLQTAGRNHPRPNNRSPVDFNAPISGWF